MGNYYTKALLLFFFTAVMILLPSRQLTACDGSGYIINNVTNNGDGTFTLNVSIHIAGADYSGGILGGTQGFYFSTSTPIISVLPPSLTSLNGTTHNAVITGNTVTWGTPGAGPFFVAASEPTQIFNVTIVTQGFPDMWNGGGMENNQCPGGAGTSTPSPGYSGTLCLPPTIDVLPVSSACQGETVFLEAIASPGATIVWSTGQQGSQVSYTPTTSTVITATATTPNCGFATESITLNVIPLPTVQPLPTIEACEGELLSLFAQTQNADLIEWSTGFIGNPLLYTATPFEPLSVTVSNQCATVTEFVDLTVNALPFLSVVEGDQTICEGESANLEVFVENADMFSWSTGETTPLIQVSPTTATTYTATVSNPCETLTEEITVEVDPQPALTIVQGDQTICVGEQATLEASTMNATTVIWSNGQNGNMATVSPTQDTTYTVAAANDCGTVEGSVNVTVLSPPEINVLDGDQNICAGESAVLQVSVAGEDTFSWSTGATDSMITVSPLQETQYTATAGNFCGTVDTTLTIGIDPPPSFTVLQGGQEICEGESATLSIDPENATMLAWDGGATDSTITVMPATATTYSVEVSNNCGMVDTSLTVTVNPLPEIAIVQGDQSICEGESATLSVQAEDEDVISWSTGENGSSITVSPGSTQTYTATASNSCSDESVFATVTVNPIYTSSLELQACPGSTVAYNGTALSPGDSQPFTLATTDGCDSIVNVTVVALPTFETNLTLEACTGSTVAYNGTTLNPGEQQSFTFSAANGCDSTVNVSVIEVPSFTSDLQLEACTGNTVTYNGTTLNPGDSQSFDFITVDGCDSVVNVTVMELPTFASNLQLETCTGTTVNYNGMALNPGDVQPFTLQAANGCDSVVTVTIMELPTFASDLQLEACPGTTVTYNGATLNPGDVQPFTLQAANGCDSVVTVTVMELPTFASDLQLEACPGTTVTYNGATLNPGDVQPFTLQAANGCDSVVTVTVMELPTFASDLQFEACPGTTVTYNGATLNPGDVQPFALQAANGCDSVVTVTVMELPTFTSDLQFEACPGTTVTYNGATLNPGDVQPFALQAANGCDSVVTVTVMELPTFASDLQLEACPGTTVTYSGATLNPGDVQPFTLQAANGCDSVVTVTVMELPTFASSLQLEACPGTTVTYNGATLNPGDVQPFTLQAANGCDSVVTVTVMELPTFASDLQLEACPGTTVTYNGATLNPGDVQPFTLQAANGCDSVVTVTVMELPTFTSDLQLQACTGFTVTYNGAVLNPGDVQSFTFSATNGCDSVVNVTVQEVTILEEDIELRTCPGTTVDYNGTSLAPGDQQDFSFVSQNGCDSIVTVSVQALPTFETTLNLQACTGTTAVYNGTVLAPGESRTFTFNAANGCDSTVMVNVMELPVFSSSLQLEACPGTAVSYDGTTLNPGESRAFTLTAANGCDSVVDVSVLELPTFEQDLSLLVCEGSTLNYNGTTLAAGDSESFTLTAANGCDSIVNVSVSGIDIFETELALQACTGTTATYNGMELAPGVTDTFSFVSQIGCDSFVYVTVAELPTFEENLQIQACEGTTINYNGTTLAPGDSQAFTLTAANGCDSVVNVSILGVENIITAEQRSICQGDSSLIFGTYLTAAGDYTETFTSAQGCDSTHTITLAVTPLPVAASQTEDACPEKANGTASVAASNGLAPYVFQWGDGFAGDSRDGLAAGVYSFTVSDARGCRQESSLSISERSLSLEIELQDISCYQAQDGFIRIAADGQGLSFSIDGQEFGGNSFFQRLGPGQYTAYVQDDYGCIYTEEGLFIEEPDELLLRLPPDTTLRLGEKLPMQALVNRPESDSLSFSWAPASSLSCSDCPRTVATPFETAFYFASVLDEQGCRAEDRILIQVNRQRRVYIPSGFSPNGDGANDIFFINTDESVVEVRSFQVFNRWGEPVFERYGFQPNNPAFGWDGKFRSELMNPAVFAYLAEIEFIDGEVEIFKGDVTLAR